MIDRHLRIGFTGGSGTGKTTLANHLVEKLKLPFNPIGSRSVAMEMGFANPYDVDEVPGKRAEFQKKLLANKRKWEDTHASFVTDRTTADNLVYTMLHNIRSIDEEDLKQYMGGLWRYTHIIHCPVAAFCQIGNDPARVQEMSYHRLYDMALDGVYDYFFSNDAPTKFLCLRHQRTLDERKSAIESFLSIR